MACLSASDPLPRELKRHTEHVHEKIAYAPNIAEDQLSLRGSQTSQRSLGDRLLYIQAHECFAVNSVGGLYEPLLSDSVGL